MVATECAGYVLYRALVLCAMCRILWPLWRTAMGSLSQRNTTVSFSSHSGNNNNYTYSNGTHDPIYHKKISINFYEFSYMQQLTTFTRKIKKFPMHCIGISMLLILRIQECMHIHVYNIVYAHSSLYMCNWVLMDMLSLSIVRATATVILVNWSWWMKWSTVLSGRTRSWRLMKSRNSHEGQSWLTWVSCDMTA